MSMELLNYLQSFLTENRKTKFEEVLSYRTKHLTVVLENIIDNHNSSAVIRSAECFGIQDIHQIDFGSKLKPAKNISRGSYNWMDIHIHKASVNNSINCIQKLKSEGYRIIATTPHIKKQSVSELDLTQKVAIFFGQEHDGLSKQVIDSADEFLIIPMYGFTESLNISVAAAIMLYDLTLRLRKSNVKWQLLEEEKLALIKRWTYNSINKPDLIIERFYAEIKSC
jgi:tRNA (guanosine-2'-O-)-methyltransferase